MKDDIPTTNEGTTLPTGEGVIAEGNDVTGQADGLGIHNKLVTPGRQPMTLQMREFFQKRYGHRWVGLAELIDDYLMVRQLDPIIEKYAYEQDMVRRILNWTIAVTVEE